MFKSETKTILMNRTKMNNAYNSMKNIHINRILVTLVCLSGAMMWPVVSAADQGKQLNSVNKERKLKLGSTSATVQSSSQAVLRGKTSRSSSDTDQQIRDFFANRRSGISQNTAQPQFKLQQNKASLASAGLSNGRKLKHVINSSANTVSFLKGDLLKTPLNLNASSNNGLSTVFSANGTASGNIITNASLRNRSDRLWDQFVSDNQSIVNIKQRDGDFVFEKLKSESDGKLHVWYKQAYQGIPYWGKTVTIHGDQQQVYLFQGNYSDKINSASIDPVIDLDTAVNVARKEIQLAASEIVTASLVYFEKDEMLLSYKIELRQGLGERWLIFVDANDARVLHRIYNIHSANHAAGELIVSTGVDLSGENNEFTAWQQDGTFYLIDPSLPKPDDQYSPIENGPNISGDTFIFDAEQKDGSSVSYVEFSDASQWDPAAISALKNTRIVYDYFLNTFGRKSFDDNYKNLFAAIHFESEYNNAFWNGSFMVYGDGDNKLFSSLVNCLDVAAHEMTHGVIEHTANLIYQNQSGALNESFTDVFASFVDRDNWTIGEDCTVASPGYLRNLADPSQGLSRQPSKMSQYRNLPNTAETDNGGVHINSGIPNRAAYLLVEGLTAEGLGTSIGYDKSEQIYYRALNLYIQASSRFADARLALVQAAEDLYGELEVQAVNDAWDAVEVFENSEIIVVPVNAGVVSGKDYMLYLSPVTAGDGQFSFLGLYAQELDDPFTGYDVTKDIGPLNLTNDGRFIPAGETRPTAFTDALGTVFFFVDEFFNLHAVFGFSERSVQLTTSGDIWSISVSPDAQFIAYTQPNAEALIHVIDTKSNNTFTFSIEANSYQEGASDSTNTLLYADALDFDFTSTKVVFDALNCISTPDSNCVDGGGYRFWSVGILDLLANDVSYPVADQNPSIDLSYPSFAKNNNFVIAMGYSVFDDSVLSDAFLSQLVILNTETQEQNVIFDFGQSDRPYISAPAFWGGDNAIMTLSLDDRLFNNAPIIQSATRLDITEDWSVVENSDAFMNDTTVIFPTMHRAAVRENTEVIRFNLDQLSFNKVLPGESQSLKLIMSNTGSSPIEILSVTSPILNFSSDLNYYQLKADESIEVNVTFSPTDSNNIESFLQIETSAVRRRYAIQLNAIKQESDSSSKSDDDGTLRKVFGCSLNIGHYSATDRNSDATSEISKSFDPMFYLLVIFSWLYIMRKRSIKEPMALK